MLKKKTIRQHFLKRSRERERGGRRGDGAYVLKPPQKAKKSFSVGGHDKM